MALYELLVEIDRGAGFDHECRPKRADGSQ
jgi:hypothetical protein